MVATMVGYQGRGTKVWKCQGRVPHLEEDGGGAPVGEAVDDARVGLEDALVQLVQVVHLPYHIRTTGR